MNTTVPATPNKRVRTIGVILAGGQSRRMQRDKALLEISCLSDSPTVLNYLIDRLESTATFNEIVVSRNADGFLRDLIPGLGPLGALHTLAENYPDYLAFVLPVDMPGLQVKEVSTYLFDELEKNDSSACYIGGFTFPLALRLDESVKQVLKKRISTARGDLSVKGFLQAIKAYKLPMPEGLNGQQFLNINTPQAWQEFLSTLY